MVRRLAVLEEHVDTLLSRNAEAQTDTDIGTIRTPAPKAKKLN